MFEMNGLKIKNRISIIFILMIAMQGIIFTIAYKAMANVVVIKQSQNNMVLISILSIAITIIFALLLINSICKPMKELNNIV